MPQYITIKNFGPITSIEKMEVKDFMLFIGERATGKSTIAKLIYFFKREIIEFYRDFYELYQSDFTIDRIGFINATLVRDIVYIVTQDRGGEVYYYYSDDKENYIRYYKGGFSFGSSLINFLNRVIDQVDELKKVSKTTNGTLEDVKVDFFFKQLEIELIDLYSSKPVFYIPSNRSSLILDDIRKAYRDIIIEKYQELIPAFKKDLRYVEIEKESETFSFLKKYDEKILKGKISLRSNGDIDINLSKQVQIPLFAASSGQQDAIGVLMPLQFLALKDYSYFTVIEEPEAGLDPKTQSLILEAIILFGNRKLENKANQVIITTHSPFILNTLSNILYASKLSKEHKEEVVQLGFTPEILLDPDKVAIYKCINGGVESIMEDGRVNNEEIDNISGETLHLLDSLIDIELKYENEV